MWEHPKGAWTHGTGSLGQSDLCASRLRRVSLGSPHSRGHDTGAYGHTSTWAGIRAYTMESSHNGCGQLVKRSLQ